MRQVRFTLLMNVMEELVTATIIEVIRGYCDSKRSQYMRNTSFRYVVNAASWKAHAAKLSSATIVEVNTGGAHRSDTW